MTRKFLICGKGGAGKSTLTALLTLALNKRSQKVFLVDADESNIGLYKMLGLDYPTPLMDHLGGKKGFREKTNAAGVSFGGPPQLFPDDFDVNTLPGGCLAAKDAYKVMSVGKIHHFGEGCACPMGSLFRLLFSSLKFDPDTLVLVDTAAGIEHFGRRLDAECDHVLCVLDPSYESVMMAQRVSRLAAEAERGFSLILNKTTPETETVMTRSLGDIPVIGRIPENSRIAMANLEGNMLDINLPEVTALCDAVSELGK